MSNNYLSDFIKTFEEVPEISNPTEKAVTKETTVEEKPIVEEKVTKKPTKVRIKIKKSTKEEDIKVENKPPTKPPVETKDENINSVETVSPTKEKLSIKKSKTTETNNTVKNNATVENSVVDEKPMVKSEDKPTYENNTVESTDDTFKENIGSLSEAISSMSEDIDSPDESKRVDNRFNTQTHKNFTNDVQDEKVDVKESKTDKNEVKIEKNETNEVKVEPQESNNTVDLEIKEDFSPNIKDPNIEKAVQEIDNDIKIERSKEEQERINARKREEMLFKKSETPMQFKPKWIALYRQALESDSNTVFSRKIRAGKFRFNDDGINEMLPDMDLTGKSSAELANATWTL